MSEVDQKVDAALDGAIAYAELYHDLQVEVADLRRELAANQQEAARVAAWGQSWSYYATHLSSCEYVKVGPWAKCSCGLERLVAGIDTHAPLKAALVAAEKRGRDTERQLTKEIIVLARQRLRREGLEAAAQWCDTERDKWNVLYEKQELITAKAASAAYHVAAKAIRALETE